MIGEKHCLPEKEVPISVAELPLRSKFRALLFYGTADGSSLSRAFDINDIRKRIIVIKSFRIVPYSAEAMIDFFVTDSGATETWSETIPVNSRINRIFDVYNNGSDIDLLLNGSPLDFFQRRVSPATIPGYPADLFLDNIYYKFPEKVQDIDLQITASVFTDLAGAVTANPLVKVIIECYLI